MKNRVFYITQGYDRGIGLEVSFKALNFLFKNNINFFKHNQIVYIANKNIFVREAKPYKLVFPYELLTVKNNELDAIDLGIKLSNQNSALITLPVNKEKIQKKYHSFIGHTEYLAEKTNSKKVMMCMKNGIFFFIFLTTHVPLKQVNTFITAKNIFNKLSEGVKFFYRSYKTNLPEIKIGIPAFNPHGGEGGIFGSEENEIIKGIKKVKSSLGIKKIVLKSADTILSEQFHDRAYDIILSIYHDQALIPLKLSEKNAIINLTVGLPFLRLSPGHGTAEDIYGKNLADPGCMIATLMEADRILNTYPR